MSYLEIQLIIAASVYFMIGVGVGAGFHLAAEEYPDFEKFSKVDKTLVFIFMCLFWLIAIIAKLTFKLFKVEQ